MPYDNRDPKRDHNIDNHPCVFRAPGLELRAKGGLLKAFRSGSVRSSRVFWQKLRRLNVRGYSLQGLMISLLMLAISALWILRP